MLKQFGFIKKELVMDLFIIPGDPICDHVVKYIRHNDAAAQFQRFEYGQMPRPRSCTPHPSWSASTTQVWSPTRTLPCAGRVFCLDVNWNRRSLHGITTFSDS